MGLITSIKTGLKVLTGFLDDYTGEDVQWIETDKWIDETPMTDSKVDSVIYRKRAGKYYARVLPAGTINMKWYLRGDGSTDDAPKFKSFLAYISQQAGYSQKNISITFPPGNYYCTETIIFDVHKLIFNFQGCEFTFPANVLGWKFRYSYSGFFEFNGALNLRAIGQDSNDGYVLANKPEYLSFLNANRIPTSIKSYFGRTLQDYIDKGDLVESLNPDDYKYHGIFTTRVLNIPELNVRGFSGCGIYFFGPAIGLRNEDGPDGHDCSMSRIHSGVFRGNRGPQIAIFGADANQIALQGTDTREGGTVGILDMSQSGTHVLFPHEAVNKWGGYFMVSNGWWTLISAYAEVNPDTFSIYNGHGLVLGGPRNTQVGYSGGFCGVITDNNAALTLDSLTTTGHIGLKNSNNYASFAIHQRNTNKVDLSFDIGGHDLALFELVDGNTKLANGRSTVGSAIAARKGLYIGNSFRTSSSSIETLPPIKWKEGDYISNNNFDGKNEEGWICISFGLTPGTNYSQLQNLTLSNAKKEDGSYESQILEFSGLTDFFTIYDTILLPGGTYYIVQPPTIVNGKTRITIHQPYILTQQAVIPNYPTAKFRAVGVGKGLDSERPSDSSWNADRKNVMLGWEYSAVDTGVKSIYTTSGYKTLAFQ